MQNKKNIDVVKRLRRSGGGGAWRRYISKRCKGVAKALVSEIAKEYKQLSDVEKAMLVEEGKLATEEHRRGQKAFGQVARDILRAGNKQAVFNRIEQRAQTSAEEASLAIATSSDATHDSLKQIAADRRILALFKRVAEEARQDFFPR